MKTSVLFQSKYGCRQKALKLLENQQRRFLEKHTHTHIYRLDHGYTLHSQFTNFTASLGEYYYSVRYKKQYHEHMVCTNK